MCEVSEGRELASASVEISDALGLIDVARMAVDSLRLPDGDGISVALACAREKLEAAGMTVEQLSAPIVAD